MNMNSRLVCCAFIMQILLTVSCRSQSNTTPDMQNSTLITRKPVVSGQFYPARKDELNAELIKLFADAEPHKTPGDVMAIISPHAGYVFSGRIAASSFNQIDPKKKYHIVFVIGSSHRTMFDGASIYNKGNYETPLGIVPVDLETANMLINKNDVFKFKTEAHEHEHCLEVQLPFLQHILETEFRIVPIVIATQNQGTCKKIATALKPYFTPDNLFIISTDFSHYPSYEDAVIVDHLTASAIVSNNPDDLVSVLRKNEQKGIDDLATSLCGWTSVLTLLNMTAGNPDLKYFDIAYQNSGDAKYYGDKSRVVGYYSIAVSSVKNNSTAGLEKAQAEPDFTLSNGSKKKLLEIARKTLESYIVSGKIPHVNENELPVETKVRCGAFVSLHVKDNLRGCIGSFGEDMPLYKVVQEMTVSSSTHDYRFSPVTENELGTIDIEISVLTPMKKIASVNEIQLGKHGIYIKKDNHTGTFLPQVAEKTGWNLEEFLGHCSRDKAGLGWDGWKDAEIYTYEAIVFSEHELM